MSVGEVGVEDASDDTRTGFEAELESTEEVRFSWDASEVRWANQREADAEAPTPFAATDRRVLFATDAGTTSIGYDHVRAVKVDSADDGMDLSTAFLGCGGLCLLVGVAVAANDLADGAGLLALAALLLVAGSAVDGSADRATVTLVIDNERQRLTFAADEDVGERLAELTGST